VIILISGIGHLFRHGKPQGRRSIFPSLGLWKTTGGQVVAKSVIDFHRGRSIKNMGEPLLTEVEDEEMEI
jgi:hypothetical protein